MLAFVGRWLVALTALALASFPVDATEPRRLAFVVGIDAYPNLPRDMQLERAVADAETVGAGLEALGYRTTRLTADVGHRSFLSRFGAFVAAIEPGDTVVFFFAGHGIAVDGTNYLIPADIPKLAPGDERLARSLSLAETDLIDDIRGRGARVTVMVIDACRDNPFPRAGTRSLGGGRGLAVKDPPEGVFAMYSAGQGQRALDRLPGDDRSRNSVFTRVFVEHLRRPGLHLVDLGETVREEVAALAKSAAHPQVPGVYNQILGARTVFLGGEAKAPPPPAASGPGPDEIAWALIEGSADARQIAALSERFPQSRLRPAWEASLAEIKRRATSAEEAGRLAGVRREAAAVETLPRRAEEAAVRPAERPPAEIAAERLRRAEAELARQAEEMGRQTEGVITRDGERRREADAAADRLRRAEAELARQAEETSKRTEAATRDTERQRLAMLPTPPQPVGAPARTIPLVLEGHTDSIQSVAVSPDGRTVASASQDGAIKLWDTVAGREARTLPGQKRAWAFSTDEKYSIAFSPSAELLAAVHKRSIKLWNAATGREIRTLSGHGNTVVTVAFSSDGRLLASGSEDDTIKLWDVATGRETRTLAGHKTTISTVAFSPDGRTLASGSLDSSPRLWDVATGRQIRVFPGAEYGTFSLAFSPDGQTLAAGSMDQSIKLWGVATGTPLKRLMGHSGWVVSVAFSPDGQVLASGSRDNSIKLWEAATGREIGALPGHLSWVSSVAFLPTGRTLASGSDDKTIKLWDVSASLPGVASGAPR